MRIAINGAGIAGPTLAYWLRESGHEVLLVEQSPEPRRGGYVVDFWGGRLRRREDGPAPAHSRAGIPGPGGPLRGPAWPEEGRVLDRGLRPDDDRRRPRGPGETDLSILHAPDRTLFLLVFRDQYLPSGTARFASSFAPRTALGLTARNLVTRLRWIPLLADLFIGRGLRDDIRLPG